MATTTMGPTGTTTTMSTGTRTDFRDERVSRNALYWIIGALAVLAIALAYANWRASRDMMTMSQNQNAVTAPVPADIPANNTNMNMSTTEQ